MVVHPSDRSAYIAFVGIVPDIRLPGSIGETAAAPLYSHHFSALQCPCLQIPVTRALKIDLFHMSDLVAPLAHSEC